MQFLDDQSLKTQFYAPAHCALAGASNRRRCKTLSDEDWIMMGTERVLGDFRSGREFLQKWNLQSDTQIGVVHFFDTASSSRRRDLIGEVNDRVARAMPPAVEDSLGDYDDFAKFDIYAGDGHYIKPSSHESEIEDKKRSYGNFYSLNLRTRAMTHLSGSELEGGAKKSEHDMHALKRIGGKALRQEAAKGRKALYAWDPAGIDLEHWGYWKSQYGVYFLSRLKSNMGFIEDAETNWDKEDPVNAGVVSDTRGRGLSSDTRLRLIIYEDPQSGERYEFITTEMTIRPGLLAWIYKCRWDIEKTYDTFKNKFGQTKAWGNSSAAKDTQASFICLAHNLMILLGEHVGVRDEKEVKRAAIRSEESRQAAASRGANFAPQYHKPTKRSQIAAKFIRWLRHCIDANLSMLRAVAALKSVYAIF